MKSSSVCISRAPYGDRSPRGRLVGFAKYRGPISVEKAELETNKNEVRDNNVDVDTVQTQTNKKKLSYKEMEEQLKIAHGQYWAPLEHVWTKRVCRFTEDNFHSLLREACPNMKPYLDTREYAFWMMDGTK